MHPSMINALRNLERKINVFNLIKDTYEIYGKPVIIVVQSLSCVQLWDPMDCSTPVSCPSLSPGVCSDSYPLSGWCYLTISSSVIPFSSHLQSFPASGSFPMSQFFTSSGRSIGASTSASVLPNENSQWIFRTYFFNDGRVGSRRSNCSQSEEIKTFSTTSSMC